MELGGGVKTIPCYKEDGKEEDTLIQTPRQCYLASDTS